MFLVEFSSEPTFLTITKTWIELQLQILSSSVALDLTEIEANSIELRNTAFFCAIDRLGVVCITLCYFEITVSEI